MKNENKKLCKKCGGACCKNCGCDFSAKDFPEITIEVLQKYIDDGIISIDALGTDELFLFVRMRNVGADAIDFVNIVATPCSALTRKGCKFDYETRPSGGKSLIPMKYTQCYYEEDVSKTWEEYQDILRQLVIKNTGMTPEEKMSERMEDIFYHFLQMEIFEPHISYYARFLQENIVKAYRKELERAIQKCNEEHRLIRNKLFISKIH